MGHTLISNIMQTLKMNQDRAYSILGSRGQGHGVLVIENGFRTIIMFSTYGHEASYTYSPWVMGVLYAFVAWGPRSWGYWWLKWFLGHNWLWLPPSIIEHNANDAPHESNSKRDFYWGVYTIFNRIKFDMDHMRISGTEPSSVILSQTK